MTQNNPEEVSDETCDKINEVAILLINVAVSARLSFAETMSAFVISMAVIDYMHRDDASLPSNKSASLIAEQFLKVRNHIEAGVAKRPDREGHRDNA